VDGFNITPTIALPTQYGGPGVALPSGQVLQAVVLALLDDNVARLQLPQAIIDIKANVPLTQGAHLTLALQGNGPHAKLVILSSDLGAAGQPGQPIGEAVVLGRVMSARAPVAGSQAAGSPALGSPAAGSAAASASAASVADAPSISPAKADPVAQALTIAVRSAATRQGGLAPLFANLEQVLRNDAKLPAAVKAAVTQLLGARVSLDGQLTAADLKQAVARSGLFLESKLASAPPSSAAPAAPQSPDLKAALLVLRQVLQTWSHETAAPTAQALPVAPSPELAAQNAKTIGLALASLVQGDTDPAKAPLPHAPLPGAPLSAPGAPPSATAPPPPPYRGAPTAAQPPALPTLADDLPPHEKAERLLAQTDAALSRQTLLQTASLPDRIDDPARPDPAAQRLSFEIPLATPQGTAVAQFEISRDGHRGAEEGQGPVWRARFSLDIEPMGPVHAQVTIIGARTSVTLWAERETSAARLAESTAQLARSLTEAELEPGEIQCRIGAPQRPRPAAGHFLDRAS
jgi:hypothetical protein